jgi:hypothetical protein
VVAAPATPTHHQQRSLTWLQQLSKWRLALLRNTRTQTPDHN